MKGGLRKIYWLMSEQFGVDPIRTYRSLVGLPRFARAWVVFRKYYSGKIGFLPCLHDWDETAGAVGDEYFWQDLYVARMIYHANPDKHVDVGSRIDGFVAHVASFRQIEVIDIRPLPAIPGVTFRQADLTKKEQSLSGYCDSLSCLHALEHFGLGRYGDEVNPNGHKAALQNMARMLVNEGTFYLSVPVGMERVEFNGHRVFDPHTIVSLAAENGLRLKEFAWCQDGHPIQEPSDPHTDLQLLGAMNYALGIFTFQKSI
ncbi:MAG: DUF268 domain-containing protein [Desulfomonilaceae bacterium]